MKSPADTTALPRAVELLLDPSIHGEPDLEEVGLRETHISWLLFTGRRVYKVKKPVDFGFLDFTTPALRLAACHEETRLNRRLSPRVYRGVVAVCEEPRARLERIEPDEEAPPEALDFAVEMLRLPDGGWLSDLLGEGRATRELMHRIAHRLVAFHARAERDAEITREGAFETVAANVRENFEQTEQFVGEALDPASRDMARAYALGFLRQREELFRRRERAGRICDGHGDLHAAQIHVGDDGIDFIDCIEFNRRFRCADVAADLAFTTMDLDYAERPDLADALALEYMARSGDPGLLELLTFYECYRAYTRGKVECLRLAQLGPVAERSRAVERARRYFELAAAYARPRRPVMLLTSGLMGTGKSTLAEALAERLGARLLSSDRLRKELAGLPADAPARDAWGEGLYAAEMTDRTYALLLRGGLEAIAAGRHAVLDASFADRSRRDLVRNAASEAGARCLTVITVLGESEQRARLARRSDSSGPSDGRVELMEAQRAAYRPPDEVPEAERIVVATDAEPAQVARTALDRVMERLLAGS